MQAAAPKRRVGVVTFNGEVTVVGDGSAQPKTVAGDKLYDEKELMAFADEEAGAFLQRPISESHKVLSEKVMQIEETGPTALGPALLTAIGMAGAGKAGSSVVLCTDGLANVGLGSLEEAKSEEAMNKAVEFYERVGVYAKEKGVTVNIISIVGEECDIETLSTISELTGGNVERVEPEMLTNNFANILSVPVIASNVTTKVKIHKGLEFRNEDAANLSADKTLLAR